MQENIPLIEVTKDEIKRIAWYRQEKPDNEVMSRMILWEDDTSEGCIEYNCCEKRLYDRIIDYFKIKKKKNSNVSSEFDISAEFELSTKMYTTEWNPPEGTIKYSYRWYTRSGRIEFEIVGKNLFEKFTAYAMKFKP